MAVLQFHSRKFRFSAMKTCILYFTLLIAPLTFASPGPDQSRVLSCQSLLAPVEDRVIPVVEAAVRSRQRIQDPAVLSWILDLLSSLRTRVLNGQENEYRVFSEQSADESLIWRFDLLLPELELVIEEITKSKSLDPREFVDPILWLMHKAHRRESPDMTRDEFGKSLKVPVAGRGTGWEMAAYLKQKFGFNNMVKMEGGLFLSFFLPYSTHQLVFGGNEVLSEEVISGIFEAVWKGRSFYSPSAAPYVIAGQTSTHGDLIVAVARTLGWSMVRRSGVVVATDSRTGKSLFIPDLQNEDSLTPLDDRDRQGIFDVLQGRRDFVMSAVPLNVDFSSLNRTQRN